MAPKLHLDTFKVPLSCLVPFFLSLLNSPFSAPFSLFIPSVNIEWEPADLFKQAAKIQCPKYYSPLHGSLPWFSEVACITQWRYESCYAGPHYFANKGPYIQSCGFSSGHIWMWELDCEESWVLKNWCFWTVVLEKTLESPLDSKEIQPVHPKGNQSWVFIGRTDVEAEAPIPWPPDVKSLESLVCCNPWGCRVRHEVVTEQQQSVWYENYKTT